MGQLMAFPKKDFADVLSRGRDAGRTQGAYLKGTEASLSYVQCFLYLVSSSINVSNFHIEWLDTFWTAIYIY